MDSATINATASAIDSASGYLAQSNMNRKTREYNEKMYAQQRADALSDWNLQNSYNSPAAQMQRFRDAGLNPNLIYGQSNEAGVVRSTSAQSWNPQPGPTDAGSKAMSSYFETKMREAQLDNMRAQNDNLVAQNRLINAQTAGVYQNINESGNRIDYRDFQKSTTQSLLPYSLEAKDNEIKKQLQYLDQQGQRHEYDLLQRSQNLKKGAQQIANMRLDAALKNLDQLYKVGMISNQDLRSQTEIIKQARETIANQILQGNLDKMAAPQVIEYLDKLFGMLRLVK